MKQLPNIYEVALGSFAGQLRLAVAAESPEDARAHAMLRLGPEALHRPSTMVKSPG